MVYRQVAPGKILAFVLALCVLVLSWPVMSFAATSSAAVPFSGDLRIMGLNPLVYANFTSQVVSDSDAGGTGGNYTYFTGYDVGNIYLWQTAGYTYNGYAFFDIEYTLVTGLADGSRMQYVTPSLDSFAFIDGLSFSIQPISRADGGCSLRFYVFFSNYTATYSGRMSLPFTIRLDAVVRDDHPLNGLLAVHNFSRSVSSDWAGDLYQYVKIQDSSGYEGVVTDQNDQLIAGQTTQNELQQESNNLQQEANDLQEESNTISSNIFAKISDFFGSFFANLGETVKSWIIPTSDQLTAFLSEVNDWFSERLGFIWYPFSLAVDIVAAFAGGSADTIFTVPALSLTLMGEQYTIWEAVEVDLDAFGVFVYVRYFTSALLVSGVVKLAYDKWDEWIGGHGVG